jgi:hypothetical protein
MGKKKPAEPAAALCHILFGIPQDRRRPVGARFGANELGIARWLARHQRLHLVAAGTEPLARLAARLPEWRLKPDGSVMLTVLTTALWEELRAVAPPEPAPAEPPPADGPAAEAVAAARLALVEPVWASLGVGDTVLAPEFDEDGELDGWWPAAVLAVTDGVFTVCWVEDPEAGFRRRRRDQLAPLHPSRAASPAAGGK